MQVNPEREFEAKTNTTAVNLSDLTDTFTAPSAGIVCGYIRCQPGQSSGYIQFKSSILGASKGIHTVINSGSYAMITIPLEKGEELGINAKSNLDGGYYGFFTAFGV